MKTLTKSFVRILTLILALGMFGTAFAQDTKPAAKPAAKHKIVAKHKAKKSSKKKAAAPAKDNGKAHETVKHSTGGETRKPATH